LLAAFFVTFFLVGISSYLRADPLDSQALLWEPTAPAAPRARVLSIPSRPF
jgi:hypothetical protein